jgi:hypothetical protein
MLLSIIIVVIAEVVDDDEPPPCKPLFKKGNIIMYVGAALKKWQ